MKDEKPQTPPRKRLHLSPAAIQFGKELGIWLARIWHQENKYPKQK